MKKIINPMQDSVDFDNEKNIVKGLYYVSYEKTYFCKENKIIHPNLKSHLKCTSCFTIYDRITFNAVNNITNFINNL